MLVPTKHQHRRLDQAEARSLTGLLADLVFESSDAPGKTLDSGSLFHLKFAADYPLVAVGAPAGARWSCLIFCIGFRIRKVVSTIKQTRYSIALGELCI